MKYVFVASILVIAVVFSACALSQTTVYDKEKNKVVNSTSKSLKIAYHIRALLMYSQKGFRGNIKDYPDNAMELCDKAVAILGDYIANGSKAAWAINFSAPYSCLVNGNTINIAKRFTDTFKFKEKELGSWTVDDSCIVAFSMLHLLARHLKNPFAPKGKYFQLLTGYFDGGKTISEINDLLANNEDPAVKTAYEKQSADDGELFQIDLAAYDAFVKAYFANTMQKMNSGFYDEMSAAKAEGPDSFISFLKASFILGVE